MDEHDVLLGECDEEVACLLHFPLHAHWILLPKRDEVVQAIGQLHENRFARRFAQVAVELGLDGFIRRKALGLRGLRHPKDDGCHALAELGAQPLKGPQMRKVFDDVVQQCRCNDVGIAHPQVRDEDQRSCPQMLEVLLAGVTARTSFEVSLRCIVCAFDQLVTRIGRRKDFADALEERSPRLHPRQQELEVLPHPLRHVERQRLTDAGRTRTHI